MLSLMNAATIHEYKIISGMICQDFYMNAFCIFSLLNVLSSQNSKFYSEKTATIIWKLQCFTNYKTVVKTVLFYIFVYQSWLDLIHWVFLQKNISYKDKILFS